MTLLRPYKQCVFTVVRVEDKTVLPDLLLHCLCPKMIGIDLGARGFNE